jgi:hypothetical protein
MKTIFTFICLVASAGLANATIQSKSDPDKPTRLYVKSDTQDLNWHTFGEGWDYYVGSAHIVDGTVDSTRKYNHNWRDGAGGSGNWSTIYSSSTVSDNDPLYTGSSTWQINGQFNWAATDWPTFTNSTSTTNGDTFLYGQPDIGFLPVQPFDPPLIQNEHCEITDNEDFSFVTNSESQVDFTRKAQTKWKLQTGGKALSKQQNLFVIGGSATAILANFAIPPFQNLPTQPIAAQSVTMGSLGTLGNDGNLFVALPDNADMDITPYVAGQKFYTFSVSALEYKLTIMANGNDLLMTNPEFCVGQQVNFSLNWNPSPPPIMEASPLWNLPQKYVNEYYPYSTTCTGYRINSDLLARSSTSCWFVNGNGGNVSFAQNMQFANGQQVVITRNGKISIYRPQISGFQSSPPFYAALVPNTNSPNELQLGDNSGNGAMRYNLHVNSTSPFSGVANIVQLVNASRSVANTYFGGGQQQTTSGQFDLDTGYLYNDDGSLINSLTSYNNLVSFSDQPGYGLNYIFGGYPANQCSINDSFKDYIVFKPDGDNNIYVTLGRVFWSWSASTTKTGDNLGYGGTWQSPTYQVAGPSAPDGSDEFPVWPETFSGTGTTGGQ